MDRLDGKARLLMATASPSACAQDPRSALSTRSGQVTEFLRFIIHSSLPKPEVNSKACVQSMLGAGSRSHRSLLLPRLKLSITGFGKAQQGHGRIARVVMVYCCKAWQHSLLVIGATCVWWW